MSAVRLILKPTKLESVLEDTWEICVHTKVQDVLVSGKPTASEWFRIRYTTQLRVMRCEDCFVCGGVLFILRGESPSF